MELPAFDILWETSEKLSELETILKQIDRSTKVKATHRKRRRRKREGLFGVHFDIEDKTYYQPLKYCCEEAFYTEPEYEAHVDTHLQCLEPGCLFVGHEKSLRVHKEVVHDGGLFSKIYRDSSDSAVLNWRESRKKNYPTLERAAVQHELIQQRLSRGQIFKTKETLNAKHARPALLSARDLRSFQAKPGTDSLTTEENILGRIDEQSLEEEEKRFVLNSDDIPFDVQPTISTNSTLCQLAADYADSDDAFHSMELPVVAVEQENNDHQIQEHDVKSIPGRSRRRKNKGNRRSDDDKESTTDDRDAGTTALTKSNTKQGPFASHPLVRLQAKRRACTKDPDRIYSRPTLLQMLLAEDVRIERNQLMQCVRYVVKNFFFDQSN